MKTQVLIRPSLSAAAIAALMLFTQLAVAAEATVYKTPTCGCCKDYVTYLRQHGFTVKAVDMDDVAPIKRKYGVPAMLEGCHTTVIDGYAIEGHVPVNTIKRLLSEKPKIKGISLPGMPAGSPGMSGTKQEPFVMYEIAEGQLREYAKE